LAMTGSPAATSRPAAHLTQSPNVKGAPANAHDGEDML
jgi:hypothetical protein